MDKRQIFFLIIILFCTAVARGQEDSSFTAGTTDQEKIAYPFMDVGIGPGYAWLIQANLTIAPFRHLYFQPRYSMSIFTNEYGYTIGCQVRVRDDAILRFGAGLSNGVNLSPDVGGGRTDRWSATYFRIGLFQYSKLGTFVNPNLNFIVGDGKKIASLNFTFAFMIL